MNPLKYFILFLFLLIGAIAKSQTGVSDPFSNEVILSHYKPKELLKIQAADSVKFNTIVYYYTSSFIADSIPCFDCVPTPLNKIDVSKYEKFRKPHERYVREFDKYGFKLTLLSIDELIYKTPAQQP